MPEPSIGDFDEYYIKYANGLKEAAILAEQMRQEHQCAISCYKANEILNCPTEDYRIWSKDCFGDTYWRFVKVNWDGNRQYLYLK